MLFFIVIPIMVVPGRMCEWVENLLRAERREHEGFFNNIPIFKKWAAHMSGLCYWQHQMWDAHIFQAWLEENK